MIYGANSYAAPMAPATYNAGPTMSTAPDMATPVASPGALFGTGNPNYPTTDAQDPGFIQPQAIPSNVPFGWSPNSPDYNAMAPSPYAPIGTLNSGPGAQGAPPVMPYGALGQGSKLVFVLLVVGAAYLLMKE
jgi:hypothetical protein